MQRKAVNARLLTKESRDAIAKIGLETCALTPGALVQKIVDEAKLCEVVAREPSVHLK